eukprot:9072908-Pyramimonas_sp.AAC.1
MTQLHSEHKVPKHFGRARDQPGARARVACAPPETRRHLAVLAGEGRAQKARGSTWRCAQPAGRRVAPWPPRLDFEAEDDQRRPPGDL